MCGISGIYSKEDNLQIILDIFTKCLNNRGPDYSSFFINKKNNFGMAHTRLSILDLSEKGHQPMYDHLNEWVISFNGEIYNHLEIREYLTKKTQNKIEWKSNSDTETILVSNQIIGFKKTLEMLEGMFAFSLYNIKENLLYLARDRIGEKPLYYYNYDNKFIFGSDLSIFKQINKINLSINVNIIPEFINKGNIGSPNSIYKFISKLEPGNYLKIKNNFSTIEKVCYWNIEDIAINFKNLRQNPKKNFFEEKEDLKAQIEHTVMKQTIADVQIGSFLSGGIDSSIITSILQTKSEKKIKTFTVGFKDKNFDESHQAKNISNYLGTDHYEYFINYKDIVNFTENINKIYTEPFADSSQIPTYLISKLMHKEAKVVLSGDGGDEFYGGYNRYLYVNFIKFVSKNLPKKLKKNLYLILKFLPTGFLNKYLAFLDIKNFENKIIKLINFIDTDNDIELYNKMISLNSSYNLFFKKDNIDKKKFFQKKEFIGDLNIQENFMYFDQTDYLPNDILCKVDRATMYNSIESRAPFLDHKLIENSWKISLDYKINGKNGKMILKDILKDYLPNKLIKRSKTGFAIPLDDLLRTKMKLWAENIIQKKNLTTNYIDDEKVKIIWDHHKNNKINAGGILWSILVLKNWFIDN
jgi:asparagine synthase (glutamine-hydrolysing)